MSVCERIVKIHSQPFFPLRAKSSITSKIREYSALRLTKKYYIVSKKKKSISPPKASFARNTQFSKIQHPSSLKLDINRTNTFANSFIPMTSRDWNSLPLFVFPASVFQDHYPQIPSTPTQTLNLFLFSRYKGPPLCVLLR